MEKEKPSYNKLWTFMAGAGSASVMFLAFLLPSIEDQMDRYQSRKVIDKYEQLGNEFFDEEKYSLAEQAYSKAYELSENKRLDIEVKRLNSKVNTIGNNPNWGAEPPEGIEDVDFQFLLKMEKGQEKIDRIAILNSYGVYLVGLKRIKEAKNAFDEAIKLDTLEAVTYINLGNLYDQQQKKTDAEKCYLKAINLDKNNARAYYNLGLLYEEQGKLMEAKKEFEKTLQIEPDDADVVVELKNIEETLSVRE
jgi:tetratricopeptide (TPR) repeat protein